MNNKIFPRELSVIEKDFLFSVLPEWKPGYELYRKKIKELVVTGRGRAGDTNFILGRAGTKPDLEAASGPIFAIGKLIGENISIDILIHEESENEIEFDISTPGTDVIPNKFNVIRSWNYSEWMPGDKSPEDNSDVREVVIKPKEYLLAVAPTRKKIWIHNFESGVNLILPVTNFYNQLMIAKNIRDTKKVVNQNRLFDELESFTDNELRSAFIIYNQYFKRVKVDIESNKPKEKEQKFIWKIFKRGKH